MNDDASEAKINAFCRRLSPLMGKALAEIALERRRTGSIAAPPRRESHTKRAG